MTKSTPDIWNHILTLMLSIVVCDKRVRADEMDSFIRNTRVMAEEIDRSLEVSDDILMQWFEARRDDISASINSANMDSFILGNILALEPFFHKQTLLNCLISISAADNEIHEKEVDVINLAAAYWDLPPIRSRVLS